MTARHYARWAGGDAYRDPLQLEAAEVPADLLARLRECRQSRDVAPGLARDTPGVQVCQVHHHGERIELGEEVEAEGREAALVEGGLGHGEGGRVGLEVDQPEHAQSALPGHACVLDTVLDAVAPLEARQGGEAAGGHGLAQLAAAAREGERFGMLACCRVQQVEGREGLRETRAALDTRQQPERPLPARCEGRVSRWQRAASKTGVLLPRLRPPAKNHAFKASHFQNSIDFFIARVLVNSSRCRSVNCVGRDEVNLSLLTS